MEQGSEFAQELLSPGGLGLLEAEGGLTRGWGLVPPGSRALPPDPTWAPC